MRADLAASYGDERLPRYTSYPTAPHFSPAVGSEADVHLDSAKQLHSRAV